MLGLTTVRYTLGWYGSLLTVKHEGVLVTGLWKSEEHLLHNATAPPERPIYLTFLLLWQFECNWPP